MADPSVIDPQELELFPKCESCSHNAAGLFYCNKLECPNSKKYCCFECFDKEEGDPIHDHKLKKTQILVNELRTILLPSLSAFNLACQELLAQASERFTPREHLIRYLEKIVTEEESKMQEMGGKMVARDYDRLKEFAAKVKRHVEVEVSEYFINKRARELIAEVPECSRPRHDQ
jgi:hypothetical protein